MSSIGFLNASRLRGRSLSCWATQSRSSTEWTTGRSLCVCQAAGRGAVESWVAGPGSDLSEELAVGVESVALDFRVAAECPPGLVVMRRSSVIMVRQMLNPDGVSGDLLVSELGRLPGSVVTVVGVFEFGWWDVAAVFVEASVVEPVDPFQGGDLDVVGGAPRPSRFDQFGLVEAVDRLGQRVVVAVAGGPDRGVDAGLGESFGVGDGGVLRAPVVVIDLGCTKDLGQVLFLERICPCRSSAESSVRSSRLRPCRW